MILVRSSLPSTQHTSNVHGNDAFNICAVSVGHSRATTLVIAVYRAPWASYSDTKLMCSMLDSTAKRRAARLIVIGNFQPAPRVVEQFEHII